MRPVSIAFAVWIALPSPVAADEAAPMSPLARSHLEVGLSHFGAKEYDRAIAEFERGFALAPRAEFLYAIAQAQRMSGDCAGAIETYRRFLDAGPPEKQAEAARRNIDRCERSLPSPEPELEPAPPVVATESAPALAPAPAPPPPARRRIDRLDLALIGTGVALAGLGAGFAIASLSDEDEATRAFTYREYRELLDRAATRRTLGLSGLTVGVALIAVGITRHLVTPPREFRVDAWAAPSAGGLAITGGW